MRLWRLVLVLALLVGIWRWSPIKAGVVIGKSMEPTLRNGQLVLIDRQYYREHPIRRGDIVAIDLGGTVYVKRVYAVPGDTVWELRDPYAPTMIVEPRLLAKMKRVVQHVPSIGHLVPVHISPDTVYVVGDASNVSCDSREFGPVPTSAILGYVRH